MNTPIIVLCNTSALHLSETYVDNTKLSLDKALEDMRVVLPLDENMETEYVCLNVEIELGCLRLLANCLHVLRMNARCGHDLWNELVGQESCHY